MAKMNFSIALNLLTQGIKQGVSEVEGYFKKLRSTIVGTLANLGIGLGIAEFGRSMIAAGKDFESGMARVRAVTNATTEDFKAMEAEAKRLGGTTKYTASEAASALENLTRNGLTPAQATEALARTLELAQANCIGLAEAADMTTNTMNAFGLTTAELGRVNDNLSSTAAHSATNVLELAEALKTAAPLANNCAISIEETNAALGTLANVGIKGSEAGTALKQVLIGLATETPQGAKALEKYGLSINQATIAADGLAGTLKKLHDSGIGNNSQDLADVFGRRAFGSAATLINNYEKFIELNDALQQSYGETARMAEQSSGRMDSALASLASAWEALQIEVFQGGESMFVAPVEALTSFIRYATENLGTLAAKIVAIFAGVKVIQYFQQWKTAAATSFMTMAQQAAAAHAKVNKLTQESSVIKRQISALETQLTQASADKRLAIEVQLEAKKRQLKQNELAITKATEAAKAADAQAAAMKSATGWQAAMLKIKAAATTAATAMKAIWSTVWPMLLMTVIVEVISKISQLVKEAVAAKNIIEDIEREAGKAETEQRAKIAALTKVVHDNTQSIKSRQAAITELQKIVPDYHASLSKEGKLINDNTNALDAYVKKLKLTTQIQAASNKLADAEMKLKDFEKNASKGVAAAYFNERMGMSETDAVREAGASLAGYRSFKSQWQKLQNNVNELNGYIEQKTKEMADVTAANPTSDTLDGGNAGGGTTSDKTKDDLQKAQEEYTKSLRELDTKKQLEIIKEDEYQRALARLNEDTLVRLMSSNDVRARESALAKQLTERVNADHAAKAERELAAVMEEYTQTLGEAERRKANGVLSEEDYTKAVVAAQTKFIQQAAAIDGLTEEQKHAIEAVQKYRKALEVGAMEAKMAAQPGRDKTFDYKLSADEIAKTEIEYQLAQAKKRLEEMKTLASEMTGEIDAQMKKITSLDEALKLAKVRADIKELQKDLAKTEWSNVKELASTTNTIVSAWTNLADTLSDEDATPWQQIQAIWNAMTQSVDGILRIVEAVNAWTTASETLQKAQAAEAAMTATTASQKVSANTMAIASDQAAMGASVAKATTEVATNTASAASSAGASAAKLPFPANLLAVAAAISAVLGMMAAIPKFASGGVVAGGPSVNDLQLARVNAGEMILNGSQQKRLWNAINSDRLGMGTGGSNIIAKLRGSTLYLLIENYKKQAKK